MFFMFLIWISNCQSNIIYYSIHKLFLYIILNYKNLKSMTYLLIFDFQKFGNIKNIRRKCNSMMDLSKFTYNKMIFSGVVAIDYKQGCSQTFSLTNLSKYPTFIILANSSSHTLTLGSILISLFILILFFSSARYCF